MSDSENEELNRQLCAIAVDDMAESWSPETQQQVLAEWNDWQDGERIPKRPRLCCNKCGKSFTPLSSATE